LFNPRDYIMNPSDSPLFEPVLWDGGGFKILDELQVPEKIEYIEAREVGAALAAVREMKTRAFGQVLTFLYSGALLAEQYHGKASEPLREEIARMTQQFCQARPTFDFSGLGADLIALVNRTPPGAEPGEWLATQARGFAAQIISGRQARAKRAAELLPSAARVLTHCNISGELVAIARYCREMGKEISVIATETRPYLQGTRLTAWELAQAGVPVSLIPDCAIAQVMVRRDVNAVIVGADRTAQNGDVINKVGTYPLALMAQAYGVPFYALVQEPRSLSRGSDVPIEERPASELLLFQGQSLMADDKIAVRYPAFDVTPARLVTRWVGFEDLHTLDSFRRKFQTPAAVDEEPAKNNGKYLLIYGLAPRGQYGFLKTALTAEQAKAILVPEMRPGLWGARLVARELAARDIPATLISDNMMGALFAAGEIRQLYLFYTRLNETGLEGICGSLLAVRLARAHGVPIELQEAGAAEEAPCDRDVASFLGRRIIPADVAVYPLQNDVIPWGLIKDQTGGDL
jgi:methylthioribose-1-phosphate isomerase